MEINLGLTSTGNPYISFDKCDNYAERQIKDYFYQRGMAQGIKLVEKINSLGHPYYEIHIDDWDKEKGEN